MGSKLTSIGSNCLIMSGCHIAHDTVIGNNVTISSNCGIGGHVIIEDEATVGGHSGLHQFTIVGKGAMIGGLSAVRDNVVPYGLVSGNRAHLLGLNLVRMRRTGVSWNEIKVLLKAFSHLFKNNSPKTAPQVVDNAINLEKLLGEGKFFQGVDLSDVHTSSAETKIREILHFILNSKNTTRTLILPKH